jgi:hypothetical protein
VRRRGLLPSVLLRRVTIFGHEQDNVLQDIPRAVCPCAEGGDGREKPKSQFHTCMEMKVLKEIRDIL